MHFGNVRHPRALPIVKCEAKFIMNQTYVDHEGYEWEGSHAYSSNSGRVLTSISEHNFLPTLVKCEVWIFIHWVCKDLTSER
jgi:hypothetical protein